LNADFATRHGSLLKDFTLANDFTIHINEPTRITDTTATVLDQFLTNFPSFVKQVEVLPPIANCDHSLITMHCSFKVTDPKPFKRTMWNFKEANFETYREKISEYNWDRCFDSNDIDVICDEITQSILEIAKSTIPNKIVTVRPNDKSWYRTTHRKMKRKMIRLYRKAKLTKQQIDWNKFKDIRAKYQEELTL